MLNWRLALLAFAMSLWTQSALAQQAAAPQDQAAESAAEANAQPTGPMNLSVTATRKPRRCAGLDANGEILVCGKDDGSDVRVPDDEARTDDGLPRAPQLDRGSCKGKPGCITGGWAPPPIYYVDVKAIPLPPKGSDAEKVAKGELRDR